jgi:DNA-binding transcriptional LysR family regulator
MQIQLEIGLLRCFTAIAESGGMGRAAKEVGRTQSALSQQVKKLEDLVQQTLMVRSGRGSKLTVHGEKLLVHAQRVLRAHDEAIAEFVGEALSGSVRLGCPDDYARVFLPPLLESFSQQYPEVVIEVVCAATPRLFEQLRDKALDLAIVSLPDGVDQDQVLRREPIVWVGAKGSDAFNQDPLHLALSDPDTLDYQAATSSLERAGRKYRIAYASGSITGLTAVVRSGQAITVLTRTAVPQELQELKSSNLPPLPHVGITVMTGRRSSSKLLNRFESHVRSLLPKL